MKRAVTIMILLLLTIGVSTFETVYVNNTFKKLDVRVSSLTGILEAHKDNVAAPESAGKVNDVLNYWYKKHKYLSIMLPHNSLVELNLKFTRLAATVECDDYEMSMIELNDLLKTMPEYNDRYMPRLVNIL